MSNQLPSELSRPKAPEFTPWTDRLAFDIALLLENSGETIQEVLDRHHIDATKLSEFSKDPVFQGKIKDYRVQIREKGLTFQLKARAQAEELLNTSWELIHHPDVSAAVKADLIKSTVKWGGLEPKGNEGSGNQNAGVSITINLGGEHVPMKVVEHSEG